MNEESGWARRYHWLGKDRLDFVCEPHNAVCSDGKPAVFNMVASESDSSRAASAELSRLPADRKTYDTTSAILEKAVSRAKIGEPEKLQALRRLARFLD